MEINIKTNGNLKKIPGTKYFVVTSPYRFELYNKGHLYMVIIVPNGFITDFGSIPSIFRIFLDKSKYISYIMHDFLYSLIGIVKTKGKERVTTWLESDKILELGLKEEGMGFLKRKIIRIGLLLGGCFNYKKYNKEIVNILKNNKNYD